MGVWSTGLYSSDFAFDLRSTIRAVSRLPFEAERLVDILRESEPAAANQESDPDHTTFWLVVADQFARRGIVSNAARERALSIIDDDRDIAMLAKLGMQPPDLKKRKKVLQEVRARITAPPSRQPRPVLRNPQPYLMDVGDVLIYPTCEGRCINPYVKSKELIKRWDPETKTSVPWARDGWAAMIIVDRGRAFEFLTWYRPLTWVHATAEKPSMEIMRQDRPWKFESPGTCSALHCKRMELEKIGAVPLDADKVKRTFPRMWPGTRQAIDDISLANKLSVRPYGVLENSTGTHHTPTIPGIEMLLTH